MKYRIEIRELNNGTFQYIPQVDQNSDRPHIKGVICTFRWMNLILSDFNEVILDDIAESHFDTEEDAISFIEEHKKQYAIESAFRVKSVTYKEL